MNNIIKTLIISVFLLGVIISGAIAEIEDKPIAMVFQPKGEVSYSNQADLWRAVSRNKFLFEGDSLKTSDKSSCSLLMLKDNTINIIASNSHIQIHEDNLKIISGSVEKSDSTVNLIDSLQRKFVRSQKYTAIRRGKDMNDTITLLSNVSGKVEYKKENYWKTVSDKMQVNIFLYSGDRVRTGADGSCDLLDQKNNIRRRIQSNTEIEISSEGTKAIVGQLTEGRSELALSDDYPELVWRNYGPRYSYKITIDDKSFTMPSLGVTNNIVRYKLADMKPGQYYYTIQVIDNGNVIALEKGRMRWLSKSDMQQFIDGKQSIAQIDPDNDFLLASYMDDYGLKVPAMDTYIKFFQNNPAENELRPFLIKIFTELKLEDNKLEEIDKYNHFKVQEVEQ